MSIEDLKKELATTAKGEDSALVAREEAGITAEIQAQLVIAQKFPRDIIAAVDRIDQAFGRVTLAEKAEYEFNRGSETTRGPSIIAMVAIAQQWGNISFEWREIERRQHESVCIAYAWDMQSNTRRATGFTVPHRIDLRGGRSRPCRDAREIYELIANMATRRMRSCLEQVIPGDVIEAAIDKARQTLIDKIELSDDVRDKMLKAFMLLGVSRKQIEKRIGRTYENVTRNQYLALRRIYQSIKDGVSNPEDFFEAVDINGLKRNDGNKDENQKPQANRKDEPKVVNEPKAAAHTDKKQGSDSDDNGIHAVTDESTGEETYWHKTAGYWDASQHSSPPEITASGQWKLRREVKQSDSTDEKSEYLLI
jgi:hypothetical protein